MPNWTDRPSEVRPVVGACACGCQVTTAGDECAALGGGGVVVGEDGLDVDRRVDSDRQRRLGPQLRPHPEGGERVQGKWEESRMNGFFTNSCYL